MKLTAAELRMRFPTMPEATIRANASDMGTVTALQVKPPALTMEERVLESLESDNQQEVIKWWDDVCGRLGLPAMVLMAFPLQGKRSPANGARMKAEGLRAGTWDMLLAVPRGYSGLWIENKTKLGKLSLSQIQFGHAMRAQGYATEVCHSPSEATRKILDYLGK